MSAHDKVHEIIIIKRGGEEEEGHHGGAWKIAFADFMTAMMALFLVLWLINAANEETKKAVASYFNPVKLVDRNRSVKGLHDAEGVQDQEVKAPNEQFPEQKTPTSSSDQKSETESQFFADPFSVLDEIAAHKAPGEVQAVEEEGGRDGNQAINDAAGGEAFMDPFSPNFWNEEVRPSNDRGQLSGHFETDGKGEASAGEQQAGDTGTAGTGDVATAGKEMPKEGETAAIAKPEEQPQEAAAADAQQSAEATQQQAVEAAAEKMRQEISASLNEAFNGTSELAGEVTVSASGGEVLISLTDAFDISMFEVGSAIPSHDLVVALEKIGGVLAEQQGGIRIRGHTDALPFKSKDYDNWRLSSARAQSAYYMLLRGGLDETRIHEISGFADRDLLDPENPLSHKNRRIEVLVEVNGA